MSAVILATSSCAHQEPTRPPSADRAAALTAEEKTAIASLKKADTSAGSFVPGKEGCLATGMVRDLGVEELQAAGLLDTDLKVPKEAAYGLLSMPKQDADTVAEVTLRCMNWRLIAMHLVDDQPSLHNKYDRGCIATITKRDVRDLVVWAFSNPNPDPALPPLYRELERAGCGFEGDG